MNALILKPLPIRSRLELYQQQAKGLIKEYRAGNRGAFHHIQQYHPRLRGRYDTNDRNQVTEAEIRKADVTPADAQSVVARWHGFASWPSLAKHVGVARKNSPVCQFESAAEAIITGDAAKLRTLLRANPGLIRARSTRAHRATLLHYVGANAVEGYRQKSPKNAVRIAEILLGAGAEVDADLDYGRMRKRYPERTGSTTLGMVATSCHPAAAGVQIPLLDLLIKHGARVDGFPGAWSPLVAALHNGRGHAAAHLAKRGASLNLEGAAGAGRLDVVRSFFNKDRSLQAGATQEQMEFGLMWACEYGHTGVVEFLLKMGVKVDARPHGETGLHWAAYGGHAAIVRTLLKRNAPVSVTDRRFDGTPLGWALYGWCEPPLEANRRGYYEVVARLVGSGAKVAEDWLATSRRGTPMMRRIHADKRMLRALKGGKTV
jgi:ankyrin repeat protein